MHHRGINLWDGVILGGLGGLVLLLTWPLWSANPDAQAAITPGDMTIYYYPFARYAIESLRAGQIPLWDPYVLGGHAFLAELQMQVLYPVRWITALLTLGEPFSYRALAAETVAHLILAAWGGYGFFRWISRNRAAAAFGAVAWGLSGYLTGYPLQAPPILATAAWLPWLLLSIARALTGHRHRHRNAILATVCWTLVFMSGFAQTAMYVYGIALLWGLVLVLSLPRESQRAALTTLGLVVVIGSGITAVQMLPTLEAAPLAQRLDQPLSERLAGFKLWELSGMVIPHVTLWSPLYFGIPTLALAGLALQRWRRFSPRNSPLWIGLAIVGLILALGNTTPIMPMLSRLIPVFAIFRNQERAAIVTVWALIVLAVQGWQQPVTRRYQLALGIIWGASGLLIAGLHLWAQTRPDGGAFQPWLYRASWSWLIMGGSWLLLRWKPKAQGAAQWLLTLLLIIDLGGTAWRTAQQGHYVRQDPADVTAVPLSDVTLPTEAQSSRLDTRGFLTGNWPSTLHLEDLHGHLTFENKFWMQFRRQVPGDRVWALMGVGCGIWSAEEPDPPFVVRKITEFPGGDTVLRLLCLEQPFPRYRVLYEAAPLEDGIALGVLADHRYDPTRTVLLAPEVEALITSAPPISPTVTIILQKAEEIRLSVQTATPGYLVIGDLWYPGWEALVDGQQVPVLRAYTALRAVEIPAGDYEVTMRYRPLSFRVGVIVSSLSLLGLLVWAFGLPKSRRR